MHFCLAGWGNHTALTWSLAWHSDEFDNFWHPLMENCYVWKHPASALPVLVHKSPQAVKGGKHKYSNFHPVRSLDVLVPIRISRVPSSRSIIMKFRLVILLKRRPSRNVIRLLTTRDLHETSGDQPPSEACAVVPTYILHATPVYRFELTIPITVCQWNIDKAANITWANPVRFHGKYQNTRFHHFWLNGYEIHMQTWFILPCLMKSVLKGLLRSTCDELVGFLGRL